MNETALVATGQPSLSINPSAYDKVTDPIKFCEWMGGLIRSSGTFGTADGPGGVAQGQIISTGQTIPAPSSATGFYARAAP